MKRIHRTLSRDIWQIENKFIVVLSNKRPYKKFSNTEYTSLEDSIKHCDIMDYLQIDENDPMAIFDKFTIKAA
tara:strand:- start:41 stop:259 length:219 start_codon:yes stop_codon:yes gene_type:complete